MYVDVCFCVLYSFSEYAEIRRKLWNRKKSRARMKVVIPIDLRQQINKYLGTEKEEFKTKTSISHLLIQKHTPLTLVSRETSLDVNPLTINLE